MHTYGITNNYILIKFLHLLIIINITSAYNYCTKGIEEQLCPLHKSHFMCEKDTDVPKQGNLLEHVPQTNKIRRILLQQHNAIRNELAGGHVDIQGVSFPKATRLRELIWDSELAYLAYEHSGQCNTILDICRNTVRFKHVGQNSHVVYNDTETVPIIPFIQRVIKEWYQTKNEISDIPNMVSGVNYFKTAEPFANIAHDFTSRMGCAIAYCNNCQLKNDSKEWKRCYFLTCNYDMSYVKGKPLYSSTQDEPAEQCNFWQAEKSSTYAHLCENHGYIIPIEE